MERQCWHQRFVQALGPLSLVLTLVVLPVWVGAVAHPARGALLLPHISRQDGPVSGAWPQSCATELFFSEYVEGSSYNKALEIINDTGAVVDLSAGNYDVQIFFNGNSSAGQTIALTGAVADGDVYVICHPSADSAILAQCDQTSSGVLFNGDDAVALRRNGVYVDVIGQIGYDPGTQWGSGDLSTADNTIRRKSTVIVGDSDGTDDFNPELIAEWDGYPSNTFDGLGTHAVECGELAPYVVSTVPSNGATGVAIADDILINFSEPVDVASPWFTIVCGGSGNHTAAVYDGPTSWTLNPDDDLYNCEQCTVTILSSQVTDQDEDDPPDNMESDYVFTFTTACSCNTIPQIQGFGTSSPCEGDSVNLSACVIGVAADGFYVQDTAGDGSPVSSDGLFVYMYGGWGNHQDLEVGYNVTVVGGEVQEYYGATEVYCGYTGCGPNGGDDVSKGGSCTLPSPATVQQIQTLGDHDPTLYENVEFMRVQMSVDGHVQGPTKRFESRFPHGDPEIAVVGWDLVGGLPHTPRLFEEDFAGYGSLNYLSGACNKDLPDVDFGDRLTATNLIGVMGYHYDKWQLILDESQVQDIYVTNSADVSDSEAVIGDNEFAICTFNVEDMFDSIDDGDGDIGDWAPPDTTVYNRMLEKRAKAIVNDLQNCTVIGVQEMEGKDEVWSALEDWIEITLSAGTDLAWDYYESMDPRDITVGILYDANRITVISSTQRQGCTVTNYNVNYANAQGPRVVPNPCSGGTYPLSNRPPYVGRLQVTDGPELIIAVNHFKSKRSSTSCNTSDCTDWREKEARHNASLANEYSGVFSNVVILGDLNDSIGSAPIGILDNATTFDGQKLVNVLKVHVLKSDQYTYIYSGESGVLDYIYLSRVFESYLTAASPMHINADFPAVEPMDSDNCSEGICSFGSGPEDDTSRHCSDHDPLFVRMGNSPTAVKLATFTARPASGGILVAWETASEIDSLGFNLYRSTSKESLGARLNAELIPSAWPGGGQGASYEFLDDTARPGSTYYYTLEDVDHSGTRTAHGPVVSLLWRVYLPLTTR